MLGTQHSLPIGTISAWAFLTGERNIGKDRQNRPVDLSTFDPEQAVTCALEGIEDNTYGLPSELFEYWMCLSDDNWDRAVRALSRIDPTGSDRTLPYSRLGIYPARAEAMLALDARPGPPVKETR